jgi:hypothetical protein
MLHDGDDHQSKIRAGALALEDIAEMLSRAGHRLAKSGLFNPPRYF